MPPRLPRGLTKLAGGALQRSEASWYAPDLRGYPGSDRPVLVGYDWGADLAWLFAHRCSSAMRHLLVFNGPHLKTLARAVLHFERLQLSRTP